MTEAHKWKNTTKTKQADLAITIKIRVDVCPEPAV